MGKEVIILCTVTVSRHTSKFRGHKIWIRKPCQRHVIIDVIAVPVHDCNNDAKVLVSISLHLASVGKATALVQSVIPYTCTNGCREVNIIKCIVKERITITTSDFYYN